MSAGAKRTRNSLIVESLEIGRVLADHGRARFRSQGTCMLPCIRPGDTLKVQSCPVGRIRVGDIAVVRKNGLLFGHRAIAKGEDENGPYIVTRPDRTGDGHDSPAHAEDILGIVTRIERNGKTSITTQMPLDGIGKLRVVLWRWWHRDARARLLRVFERIQRMGYYGPVSSLYLKVFHPILRFEVRSPLEPGQSHDVYRVYPPDRFDPSQALQGGEPVREWMLALYLGTTRVPASWVTFVRAYDDSTGRNFWHAANAGSRTRYRGTRLQQVVFCKGMDIIARSGMALEVEK